MPVLRFFDLKLCFLCVQWEGLLAYIKNQSKARMKQAKGKIGSDSQKVPDTYRIFPYSSPKAFPFDQGVSAPEKKKKQE